MEITPSYLIRNSLCRWFFKWYSFRGGEVMNLACCPIFLGGLSRSTTMETLRSPDSSCEAQASGMYYQTDGRRQNAQNKRRASKAEERAQTERIVNLKESLWKKKRKLPLIFWLKSLIWWNGVFIAYFWRLFSCKIQNDNLMKNFVKLF